jgi:ribonuclease HI
MEEKKIKLEYYTDGACSGNPGPGGFGVIQIGTIIFSEEISKLITYAYRESEDNTTNNRMEMKAIIHVLKLAAEDPNYEYDIYSDSAYVVNMCNDWIWKWAKQGWTRSRNKPIENLDLVKEIYNLLINKETEINILKCVGHENILENELADALASGNKNKFDNYINMNNVKITRHLYENLFDF